MLDPLVIRRDFPIYTDRVDEFPLIYLDNAASSQKPRAVIDAISHFSRTSYANVHRSPHSIGMAATESYEGGRAKLARFINAGSHQEIVLTRGTTEAINIVALIMTGQVLKPGDVVLASPSEHHSNIIPWQFAAKNAGAKLEYINLHENGRFDLAEIRKNWNPKTKIFTFQHASNVLGTIHPVAELCALAREKGAFSLVDGAQAIPHVKVDVQAYGCDFYALSGHKMCGPSGIGALYAKAEHLNRFEPVFGGGDMISRVRLQDADWNEIPYKFEAGTPNIEGAVGLGAAVDYLEGLGMDAVDHYVDNLASYAYGLLAEIPGVTVYGPSSGRTGAVSFWVEGCHPHDLASILDTENIAIRAGQHCAAPLMDWLCVPATARASFYIYNTRDEAEHLVRAVRGAMKILGNVA